MLMTLIDLTFPHAWTAEVLAARPLILPPRHYTYPRDAEEVERGAMEVMVRPAGAAPFLATFALGFADPAAPTGIWACPNGAEICAVSGGYAYVVNTAASEQFVQIPYRPVLEVLAAESAGLLLFVGHHSILAWGASGRAWESGRLSWEGIRVADLRETELHGFGWDLMEDREFPFVLDLNNGKHRMS